ncbi:SGT1 protein-domain-containing protein, partial [Amylocarpus encephaloides]
DYQGFTEGFDGFPKCLPDDCVEYSLFVIDAEIKSQKELLSRLEALRKEASRMAEGLLKEYIWQRDGFKLEVESEPDLGMMYLHGLTNYGDSVADEWLIVYILKELSKRFPDIWIKVVDTDGEFLLIEAANALPRWLNPEIADNRVWIHNNNLHIIPLRASSTPDAKTNPISRPLSLDEAYKTITTNASILIHSPLIEAEAFYRLHSYPNQISSSLHHAIIVIPRKLAYALHDRPASIAPATEAFYLRDPIALKPLQSTSSDLTFPTDDLVNISTRFTKVLYAQLKSQQFAPPIAWKEKLLVAESTKAQDPKLYSQVEMGMKVTSGFEMLLADPKNGDNRTVREIKILLSDLESGDETLPSDTDIAEWKDVTREDDEKWIDINFEDFERELDGKNKDQKKKAGVAGTFGPESPPGFGDAKTQADLKKMVERFESFLNDDDAGVDGAEMDDMDEDDDDDSEEDSDDEDKELSFDENEFARMMREMMGLPAEEEASNTKPTSTSQMKSTNRVEELDSDKDEDAQEAKEIQELMKGMEAELNEAGALNLDPAPSKAPALNFASLTKKQKDVFESEDESGDDGIDIDFNLAKNLLESFKSQAGMPGPGGNLMGMMGMQLPRDEDDEGKESSRR